MTNHAPPPLPPQTPPPQPPASQPSTSTARSLLFSFLPVALYAFVENYWGTVAGIIAGIVLGIGEIAFETYQLGKPQFITVATNALVIGLGALSLMEENGALFKLQPSILLLAFAAFMLSSSFLKKPFLLELARKQRPDLPEPAVELLSRLNLRISLVLVVLALIGAHAAFAWSTGAWAAYKAVGIPALLFGYMGVEVVVIRWRRR